jgi:HSP20 family protein
MFQRTLALPSEVDPAKVEATFKKGVLTVTLAKSASARNNVKKIEVKSS